jgi:serine/threonine protein kinase
MPRDKDYPQRERFSGAPRSSDGKVDLRDLRFSGAPLDLEKLLDKKRPPSPCEERPSKKPRLDAGSGSEEGEVRNDDEEKGDPKIKPKWTEDDDNIGALGKKRWQSDSEEEEKASKEGDGIVDAQTQNTAVSELLPALAPIAVDTITIVDSPLVAVVETPHLSIPHPHHRASSYRGGMHACRSVNEYKQLGQLGSGTYGTVFKAEERKSGVICALKKIKMDKEHDGFPLTSIREVRILMQCKHVNVVDVREVVVGPKPDDVFVVMEYLEHDLKNILEDMKKPFTIAEVKCIVQQLLYGLEYLHENWIIHRDIKSSNILMNNQGILKLADFGLARPYGDPLRPYTSLVVTLWYRAPELLLGTKLYGTAIDMWSAGCIFAEVLTGVAPLQGKAESEQLELIIKLCGTPIVKDWPDLGNFKTAKRFDFERNRKPDSFRSKFPESRLSDAGLQLMKDFFTYNPEKRITATQALQHPFFAETPHAKETYMMPTWPARSDKSYRRKENPSEQIVLSPQLEEERDRERETLVRDRTYSRK